MKFLAVLLLAVFASQCLASDAKARIREVKAAAAAKVATKATADVAAKANVAIKAGVKATQIPIDPTALTSSSCSGSPCAYMGDSSSYNTGGDENSNTAPAPGDVLTALQPIEDWITTMKKRVGAGGDLYNAAEATVRPLIEKLKRVQQATEEKIAESNDAIIQHVEEATTDHIYNLLLATHEIEQKQEKQQELTQAQKEFDREEKERQALQAAVVGNANATHATQAS